MVCPLPLAFAQVHGRKRVTVCPPRDSAHLYPFSVADGAPRTSRVDLWGWNRGDAAERQRFPDVARATQLECELAPGDVVYIPPAWWHHVEALDGNVSVLLPFDMTAAEQQELPRPWTTAAWGVRAAAASG